MPALVSSGRSDLLSSWRTKRTRPWSPAPETASTAALPPSAGAASNAVVRTVTTFVASPLSTVASALPA